MLLPVLAARGFGFSPDALPDAALAGLNVGLAAALGCVLTQARARQGQLLTPTRWEPLMGVADFGHKCEHAYTHVTPNPSPWTRKA